MADTFRVELQTVPTRLKSGGTCRVAFVVTSEGEGERNVLVKVAVPYADEGAGETCPLIGPNYVPELTATSDSQEGQTIPYSGTEDTRRIWSRDDGFPLEKGAGLTLAFQDLKVGAIEGSTTVIVSLNGDKDWEDFEVPIEIGADAPKLNYFTVSRDYLTTEGDIRIEGSASSVAELGLYKDGELIHTYPESKTGEGEIKFQCNDRVAATCRYRLAVIKSESQAKGGGFPAVAFVYLERGTPWQSLTLPQDVVYATQFFVLGDRLYGIFVDRSEVAKLWYSATGVSGWKEAEGDFPQEMSHSPGVVWRDKIWLIGGSGVHLDRISNSVWSYGEQGAGRMEWKEVAEKPTWPEARMGHACTVFQDKIWLLGGLGEDKFARNDVWSYSVDGNWTRQMQSAPWSARCMFTATSTPAGVKGSAVPLDQPRLWIYGGVIHPFDFDGSGELWYLSADGTWTNFSQHLPTHAVGASPTGAALLWDREQMDLRLDGKFRIDNENRPSSWTLKDAKPLVWTYREPEWNWRFGRGDSFLMRATAFKKRVFFVGLHRNPAAANPPKVWILTQ